MTTILKSYRVKPSLPINEVKKSKLEGLDKNNYFYTTVYFGYPSSLFPTNTSSYEQIINKIKEDLSILQNDFPMISGSIEYDYEGNDAHIIYDGAGVVLIEAENNNVNMDDLTILNSNFDTTSSKSISDMFSPDIKHLKNEYNALHFPFIVQVTKLKCNSIILTLINSHMLMDGYSYELLQKAWKSISKGLDYVKSDEKRINYNEIEIQSLIPKGWMEIPKQFLFKEPSEESQPIPSFRFHFSKDKINKYKEVLNNLIKEEDNSKYVTSDEVICSIMWKAVTRHRKLDKNQNTAFIRPTNIRNILKPMLSDHSFGNLAMMHDINLSSEEILSLDNLQIIRKIQLQKELYNKDKVLRNFKYFSELPFDKALVMDFVGLAQNNIFINSWSKFSSLSSFDIGFGNNSFVCLPPLMNGVILLLPSCFNQEEGIVAHVYLQEVLLQELKNDSDISNYLC
ncbi:unnamed protein product [Cunninghamella blakesleeana]